MMMMTLAVQFWRLRMSALSAMTFATTYTDRVAKMASRVDIMNIAILPLANLVPADHARPL